MSEQPLAVADTSREEVSGDDVRLSRRMRWFELGLLLSIAAGPYVYASLITLVTGEHGRGGSQRSEFGLSLIHEVTALLLLGYILSRRKLRIADLGLRWSLGGLTAGVGLAVGAYCAYWVGGLVVYMVHRAIFGPAHTDTSAHAIFGHAGIVAIPFVLVNPFFEELIVRAYLMTEVRELTGSAKLAAILSVGVQTIYHLYQGWVGALSLAFIFVVYAVYYSRTAKATPIVVAHGAFDLLAISQLW